VPYKAYPLKAPNNLGDKIDWWPVILVRLTDKHMQTKTKPFHAVVDSGSPMCLFHAELLKPFGMNLKNGVEDSLGGVGKQVKIPVYYHNIQILVGADWCIGVRAGFSEELSTAGILGRLGFFDAFRVTFDHSVHPPCLEISKHTHVVVH